MDVLTAVSDGAGLSGQHRPDRELLPLVDGVAELLGENDRPIAVRRVGQIGREVEVGRGMRGRMI